MLVMTKVFLIRFTIPTLLDIKFFEENLSKEKVLDLTTIVEKNLTLISQISEHVEQLIPIKELMVIRNDFLEMLKRSIKTDQLPDLEKAELINLLPPSLRRITVPRLKYLTMHFMFQNKDKITNLQKLPLELREEVEAGNINRLQPFGTLSSKEAYEMMMILRELLELEIKNIPMNVKQILKALKVALATSFSIEKYLFMLENLAKDVNKDLVEVSDKLLDLAGCTEELLDVLKWAIKRNRNDIFYKLLKIKSNFNVNAHVNYLLPIAIEHNNTEISDNLLGRADVDDLREKTFLLHVAAKSGHLGAVDKFLELQFDPKVRNSNGLLAIHYALVGNSLPIYERLLPHVKEYLKNEDDCFHLFRCAALNNRLNISYLIRNGLKINRKALLKAVTDQLNENMQVEIDFWGKIFSSFTKLNATREYLLNNTSEPTEGLGIKSSKGVIEIDLADKVAESNTQLKETFERVLNHPVARNLNLYERYIDGNKIKDGVLLAFLTIITIAAAATLTYGIVEKIQAQTGQSPRASSDDDANIALIVGGLLTFVDVLLFTAICVPRNKIPCTNFLRNNHPVERDTPEERVLSLNNP